MLSVGRSRGEISHLSPASLRAMSEIPVVSRERDVSVLSILSSPLLTKPKLRTKIP